VDDRDSGGGRSVLRAARRARKAGYELERKLRGGREPGPAPPWLLVVLAVVCAAAAGGGLAVAAGVVGQGLNGFDRAKWVVLGVMGVIALIAGARELVARRNR